MKRNIGNLVIIALVVRRKDEPDDHSQDHRCNDDQVANVALHADTSPINEQPRAGMPKV